MTLRSTQLNSSKSGLKSITRFNSFFDLLFPLKRK